MDLWRYGASMRQIQWNKILSEAKGRLIIISEERNWICTNDLWRWDIDSIFHATPCTDHWPIDHIQYSNTIHTALGQTEGMGKTKVWREKKSLGKCIWIEGEKFKTNDSAKPKPKWNTRTLIFERHLIRFVSLLQHEYWNRITIFGLLIYHRAAIVATHSGPLQSLMIAICHWNRPRWDWKFICDGARKTDESNEERWTVEMKWKNKQFEADLFFFVHTSMCR